MPHSAENFVATLKAQGFSQFVGVPCSYLTPLIDYLIDRQPASYIPVNNEGEAVAYAVGTEIAGVNSVVFMQNSGLGNAWNPLVSLAYPLRSPCLILCTWRGRPGEPDEPQHELMGQITLPIFSSTPIPARVLGDAPEQDIAWAKQQMLERQLPCVLVLPKGYFTPNVPPSPKPMGGTALKSRYETIEAIRTCSGPDVALVATTGHTSRELFAQDDAERNLYIVGSMGCVSSVALGIADSIPGNRRVIAIDGDGSVLMRMEAMASIGHRKPKNLIHIVLDNQVYDSTGGQQTLSAQIDIVQIGLACGYRSAISNTSMKDFTMSLESALRAPGPSLIHTRIAPGSMDNLPRPDVTPQAVKHRFSEFLGKSSR